jgi:hypothetical protein
MNVSKRDRGKERQRERETEGKRDRGKERQRERETEGKREKHKKDIQTEGKKENWCQKFEMI